MLKSGLVLYDQDTSTVRRVINLQYNPENLSRSLEIKRAGGEGGDRSEVLRLNAPAVETINLEAEIDATDQLEFPDQNPDAVELGIYPQLAALESIVYPTSSQLQTNNRLARTGTLEIVPMIAPLTLFVWSKNRILPVLLTTLNITEEFFDSLLNPIRAKVSLGMQVLSVNDVEFDSKVGSLFMTHLIQKEQLAAKNPGGTLSAFGIGGIP